MFEFSRLQDLIRRRYSVRRYQNIPIAAQVQAELQARLDALQAGPLGSPLRFRLIAAAENDSQSLRGLGSYGFIKNPTGFIVGAVQKTQCAIEDFGYAMEQAVLEATDLGLDTCWLGGTFTQSSFARRIGKRANELIPAVTATGCAEEGVRERRVAHTDNRLPWESLFFDEKFGQPLARDAQGAAQYADALEMLRLGPSAQNRQPWRVVREGVRWHFYCQRDPGYGKGTLVFALLGLADLQRVDVGIAMCHFELTARAQGLDGAWVNADPNLPLPDRNTGYIISWQEK